MKRRGEKSRCSKVGAKAEIEKVLVGVPSTLASIVGEHVFVVGSVDTDTKDRVAVVTKGTYAWKLTRYLKSAHRVAGLEQIAAIEAQRGQLDLAIEVLVLQIVDVDCALVATGAKVSAVSAEVDGVEKSRVHAAAQLDQLFDLVLRVDFEDAYERAFDRSRGESL